MKERIRSVYQFSSLGAGGGLKASRCFTIEGFRSRPVFLFCQLVRVMTPERMTICFLDCIQALLNMVTGQYASDLNAPEEYTFSVLARLGVSWAA